MDSFDNDKPKPRRWVDIPSDSDDDLPIMRNPNFSIPAPIVDPDDSYNGPPVASCCDSNKGLNEMLKKKCTATDDEDANMSPKTEDGDKVITPDGTDSKSTSAPSDFSNLCNTIRSEKSEEESRRWNSNFITGNKFCPPPQGPVLPSAQQQACTASSTYASRFFGTFPIAEKPGKAATSGNAATLHSATEFFPTLTTNVKLVEQVKRQLSVCSTEINKPKRKRRAKKKNGEIQEEAMTQPTTKDAEEAASSDTPPKRKGRVPAADEPDGKPETKDQDQADPKTKAPRKRKAVVEKEKCEETTDKPVTVMKAKNSRKKDADNENKNVQPGAPRQGKEEMTEADRDVRAEQRLREVEKMLESEEYRRYTHCASVTDPEQPDHTISLSKREWKYKFEQWRRCIKLKGGRLLEQDRLDAERAGVDGGGSSSSLSSCSPKGLEPEASSSSSTPKSPKRKASKKTKGVGIQA